MPGELAQQIPMVHAACEALGVPILTSERYEADDVIGTLAVKAAAAGFEVAIVTMDKDFFQLVGGGIRVYNPRDEGTWYDAEGVKEKFGVAPDHVVDVLALMGDTIDNIKGVPGVGEKGARELIVQYGSLENLLAHAAEVKNKRYREGLLANMEAARQSRELRAHPHRRAGRVQRRAAALSRRLARGARSRSSTSSASARWPRSTRRPPTPSPRTTASSTPPTGVRALAERLRAAGRFALARPAGRRDARCAPSIVGIVVLDRRRATATTCRSATASLDNTESLPLGGRARGAAAAVSRTRRSRRTATI